MFENVNDLSKQQSAAIKSFTSGTDTVVSLPTGHVNSLKNNKLHTSFSRSNICLSILSKCLRKILKINWPEKISNNELWSRTRQEHIPTDIERRKWAWIGYTLRKSVTV